MMVIIVQMKRKSPSCQKNQTKKTRKTREQTTSNNTNPGLRKARGTTLTTSTTSPFTPLSSTRSSTAPNLRKRLSLGSMTYDEVHTMLKTLCKNMKSTPGCTYRKMCWCHRNTLEIHMNTADLTLATRDLQQKTF